MRVVGGKYRGKKLKSFEGEDIRPTLDRVKENLFNIMQNSVFGCRFLDLFGGTGAIGIEAVSRGAEEVFIVERSKDAVKIIKDNLNGVKERVNVIFGDSLTFLKTTDKTFDIIYVDPPYAEGLYKQVFNIVKERRLLNKDGVMVAESESPLKEIDGLEIVKEKKYGRVYITVLKGI